MKRCVALLLSLCLLLTALPAALAEEAEESAPKVFSLEFKDQAEWVQKKNSKFGVSYWTASAVYCANPTHSAQQSLALYVPLAYLNEDGTLNPDAQVGSYTAQTAPIIYWNSHGSYVGMVPFGIAGQSTRSTQKGWVLNMIAEGVVVCMVGERGKQTTTEDGSVIGRGPVAIADLKAGVRFLKHNDAVIPGDSSRIISVGTSSGGAMSALLGASGNNDYYEPYLEAMGAVMDETDDVYGTMAYCPITDLAHADYAYEWMFWEDTTGLSDFQKALSVKLREEFAVYFNAQGLTDENGQPLTVPEDGSKSGSFYDWLAARYEAAFEDYAARFETDYKGIATYARAGAEDALEPLGTDNEIYGVQGSASGDPDSVRHFNQRIAEMIAELKDEFPEEYALYYDAFYEGSHDPEVVAWNTYLNALAFLTGEAESNVAPNFRINIGVSDADTSPAVCAMLALLLEKNGSDAEFNLMWGWGHNDCDTPTGLLDWVKRICP